MALHQELHLLGLEVTLLVPLLLQVLLGSPPGREEGGLQLLETESVILDGRGQVVDHSINVLLTLVQFPQGLIPSGQDIQDDNNETALDLQSILSREL